MAKFHPSYGKRKPPLTDRIEDALMENGGRMSFYDLAIALYPERESHRYQANGGPPGCYMALSAGCSRGGFFVGFDQHDARYVTMGNRKPRSRPKPASTEGGRG